jgi:polar amino acid transport system substrate-binding protein
VNSRRLLPFVLALSLLACSRIPRDPEETLKRVRGGELRVGLVEHPPWVIRTNAEPAGAEVELVRQLAGELGATPVWLWGGEQQHLEALKRFELDLVIGGLTADTPWRKEVGLTSPYFEERLVVGVPAGTPAFDSVKGRQVAAPRGQAAAAYLEKQGAQPLPVDDPAQANGPLAAPDWQLERLGFTRTAVELHTEKHVMATPPGENGWIEHLDDFLAGQRDQIKGLLQGQEARQ